MIFEIAEIKIKTGCEEQFIAAVNQAAPNFKSAAGCHLLHLFREIEDPTRFKLMVGWDSVEAHTEVFRNSQGFQNWRSLVGGFFEESPVVVHVNKVLNAF
jgi:quinol monooxygenase YgiN